MKNMSEGMQTVAGNRLRRLIGAATTNRILATGVGVITTCLVQSSSVTTVMTVGFVNAGLMTLRQAIGVIMGANIGTTITGWILVLKIGKYGLPMLGIAAFFYLFSKREKWRYLAMTVMGLGMIFFGLELMKNGFAPIKGMPQFERWFSVFQADSYFGVLKCAMVGCVLTLIVQSSSATLGITMGLASTGVIGFETAAALVLGENIGTTITAYLASLGATTNAKRAAYAHILFNIAGVLWITAVFHPYILLVKQFLHVDPGILVMAGDVETYPHIIKGIAAVHSGFNIVNTLLFMAFVPLMANSLNRFVPDKPHKETPHLTHLDIHLFESPVIGVEQCRVELMRMGEHVNKMLVHLKSVLGTGETDRDIADKILHGEEVLDIMQKEVAVYITPTRPDFNCELLTNTNRSATMWPTYSNIIYGSKTLGSSCRKMSAIQFSTCTTGWLRTPD
jgi:phosphate:Na+ symporter